MKVIFSHTISNKEDIQTKKEKILRAYTKGIFTKIKGEKLPKNSELIKIYTTSMGGAGRLVFLVNTLSGDGFFLFSRNKNDKIGYNITIKNPLFKTQLQKYLMILKTDIQTKNYEIFEVKTGSR